MPVVCRKIVYGRDAARQPTSGLRAAGSATVESKSRSSLVSRFMRHRMRPFGLRPFDRALSSPSKFWFIAKDRQKHHVVKSVELARVQLSRSPVQSVAAVAPLIKSLILLANAGLSITKKSPPCPFC